MKLGGEELLRVPKGSCYGYLGSRVGEHGKLSAVDQLTDLLERIGKCSLKQGEIVELLNKYALPKLFYRLVECHERK